MNTDVFAKAILGATDPKSVTIGFIDACLLKAFALPAIKQIAFGAGVTALHLVASQKAQEGHINLTITTLSWYPLNMVSKVQVNIRLLASLPRASTVRLVQSSDVITVHSLFEIAPTIITALAAPVSQVSALGRATLNAGVTVGRPSTWHTGHLLAAFYGNSMLDFIPAEDKGSRSPIGGTSLGASNRV